MDVEAGEVVVNTQLRGAFFYSAGLSGCSPPSPELQAVIVTVSMSTASGRGLSFNC